ncbi:MAG: pantoate--beta-alanine ligase [Elusimicrobiales bacterium]
MRIIKSSYEIKRIRRKLKCSVGFVPTMGALHEGHISLIKRAAKENEFTFVSIYVNPTQFNDPNDLKKYPKTIENDIKILKENKVDVLFLPDWKEIYPDNYTYKITENKISKMLCGNFRPGHFDGVLTVVMKLLNIVKPTRAYFGYKDFQQYLLVKGMVKAFFIDTQIIGCPTIREKDGLAKSSRNMLLDDESRKKASLIYKTIKNKDLSDKKAKEILEKNGFDVDYVETHWGRRFVAAKIAGVRLIDNVRIRKTKDWRKEL